MNENTMTTTASTPTPRDVYGRPLRAGAPVGARMYPRLAGAMCLQIAAILGGYQDAARDVYGEGRNNEKVKSSEALDIAGSGWLWSGVCAAATTDDLVALARRCDEESGVLADDGRGAQAAVWTDVARILWRHAGYYEDWW